MSVYQTIADLVLDEVERATSKFPLWPTDILHAVAVVKEESGELSKACLQVVYEPHKSNIEDVRSEAIQTAAMAFRFLASLDRYELITSEQHSQQDIGEDDAPELTKEWFNKAIRNDPSKDIGE